ncbi:hybrid sensor histidine kinase/response regulator [Pseudomonas lundensis]|uniref:histidine kinase n=1 Tax=Pseudomonas lundensis TaxID=86185 RepID=A0A266N7C9_9PSED|nr:PAS domain-containing hybrid sensor histidine kinase/response regulator [Pseudomonas lundensis]OZY58356.1 hybrid sensor histidine kinase/response regulator [Pseudomonas lundensis]
MSAVFSLSQLAPLSQRLDWQRNPLGEVADWPQSLRTCVQLLMNSPMPMLLLWGKQLTQIYNDSFAVLAGDKHPDAFGQPVHQSWPEYREFTQPIIDAVLAGESRSHIDQYFLIPDRQHANEMWLDLTFSPVCDDTGEVAGLLMMAVKASRRRRTAIKLRQRSKATRKAQHDTEERLRLAQTVTNGVGTWDWNIDQDLFVTDSRFAQMHGIEPQLSGQLPITAYLEGVHPEDRGLLTRSIKACLASNGEYAEEYRLLDANGTIRWIFARGRCFSADPGRAQRFMGAALDITERKKTEQALLHLNETLEERVAERTQALAEANEQLQREMQERERAEDALRHAQKMEAVGQLTGGIAHDFNNMLTGIIGSLDLMKRYIAAGRSAEIGRFTDAAVSSAQRAAALTHRLLAFSRRQSLDRKPLDPNHLVTSLEELFRRTKGAHITLDVQLGDNIWAVNTDAGQLESALLNLIINARDAMPQGGTLRVRTRNSYLDGSDISTLEPVKAGDYVMLEVSDNGSGMTPQVLAKAFDPFFTTKPIGQGTGLGLSMIYGFAQQSGGHVTITSESGNGTCVRLYLPRHYNLQVQPRPPVVSPDAPCAIEGESVLVVEDDPAVRTLVLNVLDELGYTAHQAPDAKTALSLLESSLRIDLLVTDVGLPGMNGRQLAEIARQQRPGLNVLFMTGYAESAIQREGFLDSGMDMIGKPFSVDKLATLIRAMIPAKTQA